MGKKSWASADQLQWLNSKLPHFCTARATKGGAEFLHTTYAEFTTQWPVPPPTPKEIADTSGNLELAATNKMKACENVSPFANISYSRYINLLDVTANPN